MYDPGTKQLLKTGTLEDFCDAYAQAVKTIEDAVNAIAAAKARVCRSIERFNILPTQISDYDLTDPEHLLKKCRAEMQRSAWHEVVRMTGVPDVMTEKKRDELRKNIDAGQVPPLTLESVQGLLNGLRGDLGKIIDESIAEAARVLMPHNERWKTNSDWKVGKKAILAHSISWDKFCGFSLHYHRDADINAIDNAFHLMDGRGVPKYEDRLAAAIRVAMKEGRQECATELFFCRWFKAGSLHLTFKRADLVDDLNRRTGDGRSLRKPTTAPEGAIVRTGETI